MVRPIASVLALFIAGAIFSQSCAIAAPVYKWQDESGIVHYSSKPHSPDAKPAELPRIMRGEVKLSTRQLVTCDSHGGTNCKAGADTDGSVICYDGFRNSSARFRFTCTSPKLELVDVSELGSDGSFTVFVRNSRSVTAQKPSVSFKSPDGAEAVLTGPAEIEALGMAEFSYKPGAGVTALAEKPNAGQLTFACANCP